jgi:hypothetical protein
MTTTISPSLGHAPLLTQGGTGASPGFDAIDFRRLATAGLQEGVMAPGSFEVTQRGAGANMSVDVAASTADALGSGVAALVQGDAVTAQSLYPVAPHSAVINEAISAAHATLPRVDQVVLEIKDNTHDASGSNLAQVRVVAGTATSGATLNNRTGAASLPASALLLADVLVAAAASSITNSVIRDRRKWARGAYCRVIRTANASAGDDYTISADPITALDATNIKPRIECSGAPVQVRLACTIVRTSGSAGLTFSPQVDGAGIDGMPNEGATSAGVVGIFTLGETGPPCYEWTFVPSAGSHLIYPAFGAVSTFAFRARAGSPLIWEVKELLTQNTANNRTTTG